MHEEPKHFDNLTTEQLIERTELTWLRYIKLCQDNFLMFVQEMWPQFICRKEKNEKDWGHHQIIANEFQKIANGSINRLIVNMPPRHTKSEFASTFFPAWLIGKNPKLKIMQVSHNTELAVRFGSKVRNLMEQAEYKQIFWRCSFTRGLQSKGTLGN
jgi:hypothetical protein